MSVQRRCPVVLLRVLLGIATLLAVPALSASAGPPGELRIEIVSVDDSAFPSVTAVVNVLDPANRPVIGLAADRIEAAESGEPAAVTSVARATDVDLPIGVVLAIDVSGSMAGPSIDQARTAALAFLDTLGPADQAAVVAFSDAVQLVQPMTADRETLRAAIGSLQAGGNTALYQGVTEAIVRASQSGLPRRVVILLSDGEDFGGVSTVNRADSLNGAAFAGVPVYAIGLGASIDTPYLEQLAGATRGDLLIAPSPDDIAAGYALLAELLRSQYIVTVESTADPAEQVRALNITVTTDTATGTAGLFYGSSREPTPPPSAATPPPPTAETSDEGTGFPVAIVALGAAAALIVVIGAVLFLLRRREPSTVYNVELAEAVHLRTDPLRRALDADRPRITLQVLTGELAGRVFELGAEPLTIGTHRNCDLRFPADNGVAPEHARVWWRGDKLMLHHLGRGRTTIVGGEAVTWTSLDTGDVIEIADHRVRVDIQPATGA